MADKKIILVLGPTGTQGKAIVNELLEDGEFAVRAFARKKNLMLPSLEQRGVELAYGDVLDQDSLEKAMEGVYGLYFLPPLTSGTDSSIEIQVGKNVIAAAEKTGVEIMVHSSVDRAGEQETFERWGPDFWAEYGEYWVGKSAVIDLVKITKVPHWTILKPAFMMDCFIPPKSTFMFPELKRGLVASARVPKTSVPMMCGDDMGKLALKAFKYITPFDEKEIPLAGDCVTMTDVAAAISKATGKVVTAKTLPREELEARSSVIDAQEWDNVNGYTADIAYANSFGVKLSSFEDWAERHKDEFQVG